MKVNERIYRVGAADGEAVGSAVGDAVGSSVGRAVGYHVGSAVGAAVPHDVLLVRTTYLPFIY